MWPLCLLTFQHHGNYSCPSSLKFLRYLIVANMYNTFVHLGIILEVIRRAGTYARVDNEMTMVYDCIRFRDNLKIQQQGTKKHIIIQPRVKMIMYELKLPLGYVCDSED